MEVITVKDCSLETIGKISKINEEIILLISPEYNNIIKKFVGFECINNLAGIRLGMYVDKNISFIPLSNISTLKEFIFENGFGHKTQYEFINSQKILQKISVCNIDLAFIKRNEIINDLYIHRSIKNENLLSELFPNLLKFQLHGDTKRIDYNFINNMENLETIALNYNSNLVSFPKIKNHDKIKSISLLNCYNFNNIESILVYKNLEKFCLTSHDKILQLKVNDFIKLKQLSKLKIVYTHWGKKEPEEIKEIYRETGWINKNV